MDVKHKTILHVAIAVAMFGTLLFPFPVVEGTIAVINEDTGRVVRFIEERNMRSMSDALEGYIINSNPSNVCEPPEPPPKSPAGEIPKKRWILLGTIPDCDLSTKAKHAEQSGYSGLIVQNVGANNSNVLAWNIMRFPLAKINNVVVGEYDGRLLGQNYSFPNNKYYVKFEEDYLYQILCYVLAGIILVLLGAMFFIFWFQICCTIITLRLPYRLMRRIRRWLRPGKRRLTRTTLQLLPVKTWVTTDPFQACAICQEDFKEGEKARVLPCGHGFHSICIDPWLLRRSRRCPNCMRWVKLPNEPDVEEYFDSESSSSYQEPSSHHHHHQSRSRTGSHSHSHCSRSRRHSLSLEGKMTGMESPLLPSKGLKPSGSPQGGKGKKSEPKAILITTTATVTQENKTSPTSEREWQLKSFLNTFQIAPFPQRSTSKSLTEDPSEFRQQIPHSHSFPFPSPLPPSKGEKESNKGSSLKKKKEHPPIIMKPAKAHSQLQETCLDLPISHVEKDLTPTFSGSSSQDHEHDHAHIAALFPTIPASRIPFVDDTEASTLPREYDNPGYFSLDDGENDTDVDLDTEGTEADLEIDTDDLFLPPQNPKIVENADGPVEGERMEATAEPDLTSSFDATTISESLPMDKEDETETEEEMEDEDEDNSLICRIFEDLEVEENKEKEGACSCDKENDRDFQSNAKDSDFDSSSISSLEKVSVNQSGKRKNSFQQISTKNSNSAGSPANATKSFGCYSNAANVAVGVGQKCMGMGMTGSPYMSSRSQSQSIDGTRGVFSISVGGVKGVGV